MRQPGNCGTAIFHFGDYHAQPGARHRFRHSAPADRLAACVCILTVYVYFGEKCVFMYQCMHMRTITSTEVCAHTGNFQISICVCAYREMKLRAIWNSVAVNNTSKIFHISLFQ